MTHSPFPPLPSEAECRKLAEQHAGELTVVTVCECGIINYSTRLGCSCGNTIGNGAEWAYIHQADVIRPGIDFCFIDQSREPEWIEIPAVLRRGDD